MIHIVPSHPEHDAELATMIVGIQRDEFGFAISLDDQPDLADIPRFYRVGAGNFWVALDEGRVIGTIGLKDFGKGQGALRKMFVATTHRGTLGVAHALIVTLLDWCAAHGIGDVWLGTTERFVAAHRFYEKEGFERVDEAVLPPHFPRMSVDTRFYWRAVEPAA